MSGDFQEIEFTIQKDGTVDYVIRGIKGRGCEELSRIFEKLGRVTESGKTGDYYEREEEARVVTRRK